MAQPIAALIVRVAADVSELKGDVSNIEGTLNKAGGVLKTFGAALAAAFTVQAVVEMGRNVIDFASHLEDLKAKSGLSTTALQKLQLAFGQSGVSIDEVINATEKLSKNLIGGDKGTVYALQAMGLSVSTLKTLDPETLFMTVADAVGKIESPTEKAYAAMTVFGKGGAQVLPGLTGHLQTTTKEFENLGLIINEQTITAAHEFGIKIDLISKQLLGVVAQILGPLLPALSALGSALSWLAGNVIGPIFNVAIKSAMTVVGLFWEGLSALLGGLVGLGSKLPGIGSKFAELSNWLNNSSQKTTEYLHGLWQATDQVGDTAVKVHPHVIGLGEDFDKIARAAEEARKKQEKFNDSIKRYFLLSSDGLMGLAPALEGLERSFVGWGEVANGTINAVGESWVLTQVHLDVLGHAIEEKGIPALGQLSDRVDLTKEETSKLAQQFDSLQDSIAHNLAAAIVHAQSFGDAMKGIFQSIQQVATDILSDILKNVLHSFLTSMTKEIGDSQADTTTSFGKMFSGFPNILGKMGDQLSGWIAGAKGQIAALAATAAGVAGMIANRGTGSDILSGAAAGAGIGFMVGGPLGAVVGGGIGAAAGLAEGLILGDEEQRSVNPARDAWWNAHGGLAGVNAAAMDAAALSWDQTQALDQAVFNARNMADFGAATQRFRDLGVPGFIAGTGGMFLDFGRGTPAVLHGRERIVTEAEGHRDASSSAALLDELQGIRDDFKRMPAMIGLAVKHGMLQAV